MTQNLPARAAPKANIQAGGQVAAIVPQTLDECFRLSQAMAISGMAPRGIDKPEQIMVAIMAGAELGLAPFQSLQSFAVVNGRPTLWGDGLIAVVRARGVRVKEWIEGEGDGMVARCLATRPDTQEEIERAFSVADAKKAGLWGKQGPWQSYPKRMLQMRARALALRDGCADMLRGIQVREEVEDYAPMRDVTPQRSGVMDRLPGASTGAGFAASNMDQLSHPTAPEDIDAVLDGDFIPEHDPKTGEIIETTPSDDGPEPSSVVEGEREGAEASGGAVRPGSSVDGPPARTAPEEFPGDKPATTLAEKVQAFKDRCRKAPNLIKLRSIGNAAGALRKELDAKDPELLADLEQWFEERVALVEQAEREAGQ